MLIDSSVNQNHRSSIAAVRLRKAIDMKLRDFFSADAVELNLQAKSKDEVLSELVSLLSLDEKSEGILIKMLKRREHLGSTGFGGGVAIPHCRSLVVKRLRVAFGRKLDGLAFDALDGEPVSHFFLIVAPPLEVTNPQYLPVLGKIAQFCKDPESIARISELDTVEEFLSLLEEKAT